MLSVNIEFYFTCETKCISETADLSFFYYLQLDINVLVSGVGV